VNIVFFIIYASLGSDELGLYTYDVIANFKFWFSSFLILFIALIPVIISHKIECFLSQNIVNNLRNRNFEDDYTRKICIKKIEQMHKCSRSLAKFRRIYAANSKNNNNNINNNNDVNNQNLADKKMKEIVDQYKNTKKLNKIQNNVLQSNENLNLNNKEDENIRNFEVIRDNGKGMFQRAKTSEFNNGQIIKISINNKNKSRFDKDREKKIHW